MQNHEVVTEEQRKFEAMLKYYQQRVTCCVCNRTKLRHAVDDLVSFLLETINTLRVKLELREKEVEGLQAQLAAVKAAIPCFTVPKGAESILCDGEPGTIEVINPGPMFTAADGEINEEVQR